MKYFEALYNENRNAVPSWQGYHYQAQVATLYFMNTILEFVQNGKSPNKLQLKIEWLEDFIILENAKILEICQVKKTLDCAEYKEVLQNFIPQFCIKEYDECKWKIIYSENTVSDTEVELNKIEDIFKDSVLKVFMKEMKLLEDNIANHEYWENNLKLGSSPSKLTHIRYYLRKLLRLDGLEFVKINQVEFEEKFQEYYENLQKKLVFDTKMQNDFKSCLQLKQDRIEDLHEKTKKSVERLCEYMSKSTIISDDDIIEYLYGFVYSRLMKIKNKKSEDLIITYKNIEEIFLCQQQEKYIYERALYEKKIEMDKVIDGKCKKCKDDGTDCKALDYCVLRELLEADFKSLIEDISLELPKYNSKLLKTLTDLMTDAKIKYIVSLCDRYKFDESVNYSNERKHLLAKESFISALIADPNDDEYIMYNILENFREHECIYRDYDKITTKYFEREFSTEDIKIISDNEKYIKNNEDYIPKIKDFLPVKFEKI